MMTILRYLFLWVSLVPVVAVSQSVKRDYRKGEIFSYRLTTETFRNEQPDTKAVAVSWHTVMEESGQLGEEVRWLLKTVYTPKDTLLYDSIAQRVAPYKISLVAKGQLKVPPLSIPEMTGEITDLHTFYVAVSKLPSFKDSVLHGKFADGVVILNGEDRIQVSQRLVRKDRKTVVVETAFGPPPQLSIIPLVDTIGKQIFAFPNNFQMVRKAAGDKVNLLWGVEEFIITSVLDNRTGQLLEARMINTLNLRMRYNATPDLKNYDGEIPLTIKRIVQLQLLK